MTKYPIALFCDHPEIHFECRIVAQLARVSEAFILRCEREALIETRPMLHGRRGVCCADVKKLKLIRHLHEDMGLDLEAVDFVLRYREKIKSIQRRLDQMERRMRRKEQAHQRELQGLRRRLARQ